MSMIFRMIAVDGPESSALMDEMAFHEAIFDDSALSLEKDFMLVGEVLRRLAPDLDTDPLLGGEMLGLEAGFSPPFFFDASAVQRLTTAVGTPTNEQIEEAFDTDDIRNNAEYMWALDFMSPQEQDAYVVELVSRYATFVSSAASRGHCLVSAIV